MSFNYSNPYAAQSSNPFSIPSAPIARSSFLAAVSSGSKGYQLFWSGLPTDIAEGELTELLTREKISLNTSSVQCFYTADGTSLGMAMIQVSNEDDAERLRRQYSGNTIDGTFRLSVQHMLAPTQSFPQAAIPAYPMQPPAPPAPAASQPKGARTQASGSKPNQGGKEVNDKPPGLSLLKRMSGPGKAGNGHDQSSLLARQKANMKGSSPGLALAGRLSGSRVPTVASTKAKTARNVSTGGSAKVGRAKERASKDAMEVDQVAGGKKSKPANGRPEKTTQEKLDEDMRNWERQRRFAA